MFLGIVLDQDGGHVVQMRQANQELGNAEQSRRCGETGSLGAELE
jgi:hypothetical protein